MMSVLLLMASLTNKIHIVPHFNCVVSRNVVVTLMMLQAACDADASANGIK